MSRTIVIGIVVGVIGIFALGGFLLWQMHPASPAQPAQQPLPTPVPVPSSQLEGVVLDTSAWQTYRSEEFGFEVKYPETLLLKSPYVGVDPTAYDFAIEISNVNNPFSVWCGEEENETGINPCDYNYVVYIFLNNLALQKLTFPDYIQNSYGNINQQKIAINGKEFIKLESRFTYIIQNNNFVYVITLITGEAAKETSSQLFDQILSTFRFVEDTEISAIEKRLDECTTHQSGSTIQVVDMVINSACLRKYWEGDNRVSSEKFTLRCS